MLRRLTMAPRLMACGSMLVVLIAGWQWLPIQVAEGKTYVVAAGETFKLLQVNPLDEMALATPAIAGERLLIRTESRLYSIRQMRPHR
jgi:hypothetical protein